MEYVIPAAIVLFGNVFSGSRGSRQWETVTALFGWVAGIAGALWLLCLFLGSEFWARQIFFPSGSSVCFRLFPETTKRS